MLLICNSCEQNVQVLFVNLGYQLLSLLEAVCGRWKNLLKNVHLLIVWLEKLEYYHPCINEIGIDKESEAVLNELSYNHWDNSLTKTDTRIRNAPVMNETIAVIAKGTNSLRVRPSENQEMSIAIPSNMNPVADTDIKMGRTYVVLFH